MLIFVYNAKGDIVHKAIDYAHKIISPKTYQCHLCALTYHHFGVKEAWEKFVNSVDEKIEFMHIGDFEKQYKKKSEYPAVFRKEDVLEEIITSTEINTCDSLDQLIQLVSKKI